MNKKSELLIELEETKEALSRSRSLRQSLTSQFDPSWAPSIEERARRLFILCYRVPEDYQFDTEKKKEFWMQQYISIVS